MEHLNTDTPNHLKLVEGTFEPLEASEMLLSLINAKLSYHRMQEFSARVRGSDDMEHAVRRCKELIATKKDVRLLIDYAEENGLKLRIHSVVTIDFTK